MSTTSLRQELKARQELPPPAERRAIRERAGISLETVARELGVSRQCVGHWEAGRRFPRSGLLRRYVRVLQLLANGSQRVVEMRAFAREAGMEHLSEPLDDELDRLQPARSP